MPERFAGMDIADQHLEKLQGDQVHREVQAMIDLEGPPPLTAGPLVGRQGEVEALAGWFQRAAHGTRQLVFISGEAGVGKTTVVKLFLARLATGSGVCGPRGGSASSTLGRGSRTCPSWKRGGGWAMGRSAMRSAPCYASMRR